MSVQTHLVRLCFLCDPDLQPDGSNGERIEAVVGPPRLLSHDFATDDLTEFEISDTSSLPQSLPW